MKYPLPSYAANIWLAGSTLWLSMPGHDQYDRNHVVQVPINITLIKNLISDTENIDLETRKTLQGLFVILNTLHERHQVGAADRIGNKSAPTQWDIDQVLKAISSGRVTKIEKKKSINELSFDEMMEGLDEVMEEAK